MLRTARFSLLALLALVCATASYAHASSPMTAPDLPLLADDAHALQLARGPLAKVGFPLASLFDEYQTYLRHQAETSDHQPFVPDHTQLRVANEHVSIDAVAAGDPMALKHDLEALGLDHVAQWGRLVGGRLPLGAIDDLAALESLQFARPVYAHTGAGLVTSQGDAALRANSARSNYGVGGGGVTIGTLSDSYNCLGGADQDVSSDDLPPGVNVLAEFSDCAHGSDEGRAMMQIIHDLAPESALSFHTGFESEADFAQGIVDLANAGARVIVDDIGYGTTPMFQDGALAQAVNQVKSKGVSYFSAAGNSGRLSYESGFRNGPSLNVGAIQYVAHDFDSGSGTDPYQAITVPPFGSLALALQWDQPAFSVSGPPGSASDLDVWFVNSAGIPFDTSIQLPGIDSNTGGDPSEYAIFVNPTFATVQINIFIGKRSGPTPSLIKYILFGTGVSIAQFSTNSSTTYGQPNADGAIGVGAAFYGDTPPFGTSPAVLEEFSSSGGTPILFDQNGARKPAPEIRQKPDVVGPDGVNTTFFGSDSSADVDRAPNFFGTSAAAPHIAAVAALLLDANPSLAPDEIYATLRQTSADMATPGFDFDSGFGLVQADTAVGRVLADLVVTTTQTLNQVPFGADIVYTLNIANVTANPLGRAVDVSLTDTLPAGAAFVSATAGNGAPCAVSGGVLSCALGTLESGKRLSVSLRVTPTAPGTLVNSARVASATTESVTSNNNSVNTTSVPGGTSGEADLGILFIDAPAAVLPGAPLTYTLRVSNAGLETANAVTTTVTLPSGVAFTDVSGSGWSCLSGSGVIRCTRSSLPVALAPDLQIGALAASSNFVVSAVVTSNQPDSNPANSSASSTTGILVRRAILPMVVK